MDQKRENKIGELQKKLHNLESKRAILGNEHVNDRAERLRLPPSHSVVQ